MKRVLLVGGAGFIGKNLREAFEAGSERVVTIDPASRAAASDTFNIPLHDSLRMHRLMQDFQIDVVVHLASALLPSDGVEEFEREQEQIIAPTFRLIEYCAEIGARFMLFSSGGTVYGDAGLLRVPETHVLAPKTFYGYAKIMLEEYTRLCHRMRGLEYNILRPSNPYGKHQDPQGTQGFIAVALGKMLRGEAIEIWGDGSVVRDYLDVHDLAAAVVNLVRSDVVNRVLNIGSGVGHSLNEVLAILQERTGRTPQVIQKPPRRVDIQSVVLDTTHLSSVIPWHPRELAVGISDLYHRLRQDHAS